MDASASRMVKVVIIGSSGVGKTCLIHRLIQMVFVDGFQQTIASSVHDWTAQSNNREINIKLWDTAGQERYKSLVQVYFRDSVAAICVYDASDPDPMQNVCDWIHTYREAVGPNPILFVAGNKIDASDDKMKSLEMLNIIRNETAAECFLVSAKTGEGVDILFQTVADRIEERLPYGPIEETLMKAEKSSCC